MKRIETPDHPLMDFSRAWLSNGEPPLSGTSWPRARRPIIANGWTEILKKFASLPIEALDDRAVRQHFIKWRNKWAATPRQADHAITTLKALLTWGVRQSIIEKNYARGIGNLYTVDKSDQIWDAGTK